MRTETRSLRNLPERRRTMVAGQVNLVIATRRGKVVRREEREVRICPQVYELRILLLHRRKDAPGDEQRLVGDVISGTLKLVVWLGARSCRQVSKLRLYSRPLRGKDALGDGQRRVGDVISG